MTTPCQRDPHAYDQPGDDPAWHLAPRHRAAARACIVSCPRPIEDCAREALASGTIPGQAQQRVANGVIQAGVVCRGDLTTHQALVALAYPNGGGPEYVAPDDGAEECAVCTRLFVPEPELIADPAREARRAVKHSPLCMACYKAAWRSGALTPAHSTPESCIGCREPMTTRYKPLPGHVVHESHGRCRACARAAQRAEKEAAA